MLCLHSTALADSDLLLPTSSGLSPDLLLPTTEIDFAMQCEKRLQSDIN